ncbi:MAG: 4-(cytidine 5'-diphospho)-2-C-methyl-D-erythritol kinase [Candidatus Omnitrophota bacterium]
MKSIRLLAPAKINLYLDIVGRRRDGYHNILTFLHKINLADTIELKPRQQKIVVKCSHAHVPSGRTNLVYKAARMLQQKTCTNFGAEIKIIKRIPPASGLAGGSSDAASVLLGLNRLWKLKIPAKTLELWAAEIGADVPFFVSRYNSAIARGIGDKLRPIDTTAKYWVVLAVPHRRISTKKIYRLLKQILTKRPGNVKLIIHAFKHKDLETLSVYLYNALEHITLKRCKETGKIKSLFSLLGCKVALMSGSGPTVFTLTTSRGEARRIAQSTSSEKCETFVVRSL